MGEGVIGDVRPDMRRASKGTNEYTSPRDGANVEETRQDLSRDKVPKKEKHAFANHVLERPVW